MKISYAVEHIIQPVIKKAYKTDFILKHVVGIDTSALRAARIGVHGDNDLVWVGSAANHAAKLCSLSKRPLWITKAVFDVITNDLKESNGAQMWEQFTWNTMNNATIYGSTYWWRVD